MISETLSLPAGVTLAGTGVGATILKLPAKAKYDILHSAEWETLKGTTSGAGLTNGGFREITFNGNRNEETKAPSEESGLVSIFGYAYRCERFQIELAPGNGFVSEWGNGSSAPMEAWVSDFKITNPKSIGLLWKGPHDSIVKDGQIISAEKYGVKTAGHGTSTTFDNVHCWGGAAEYNWLLEVEAYLFGCQGEDASKAALWILHNATHVLGGQFFASPVGIKLGESGKEIGQTVIDTVIFECSTTALEIVGNDWQGYYKLNVSPASETLAAIYKGSLASNSTLLAYPRNATGSHIQYPGKTVITFGEEPGQIGVHNDELAFSASSIGFFGTTPIGKPAAITAPAETTKANTEAIKSLITTLKNLGLTS